MKSIQAKGFPLTIYPSFWVVALLIAYLASPTILIGFLWVFVIVGSVLLHEFGHAGAAQFFGQRVHIELSFFGGATFRRGPTLSPAKDFFVVLMGPLMSLCLGGASIFILNLLSEKESVLGQFLMISAVANFYWTFLNVLPVLPLDGGKMMQIIVCAVMRKRGEMISYFLSFLASLALMVFFLYFGALFIGLLFLMLGFENYRMCIRRGGNVTSAMEKEVSQEMLRAEHEWTAKHPEAAIDRLERLCDKYRGNVSFVAPTELLARYLLTTGKPKIALHYLMRVERRLSVEGLKLMQLAAYETMEWKKALDVGERIFSEEGGDVSNALINAFSAARLSLADIAINWLLSAQDNVADMQKVVRSEDFDLIRDEEKFVRFVSNLRASG